MVEKIEIGRLPGMASKVEGMLRFVKVDGDDLVIIGTPRKKLSDAERAESVARRKRKLKELMSVKGKYRDQAKSASKAAKDEYADALKKRRPVEEAIISKERKAMDLYRRVKACKSVDEINKLVSSI